jgi:phosphonate transport system substrate-binding protein
MKWIRAMAVPIFWITIAGLGMQHAGSAPASPLANQELKPTRLYVVASESMFTNYIKDDATASLGIWIKKLCELEGLRCDVRVDVVNSIAEIRRRIRERTVDLLIIDTPEYLILAHEGLVEAMTASTTQGKLSFYSYLLLTRNEGGAAQIAALRGKLISVASRHGSNLGLIWLETLLAENKLDRAASFFGSVEVGNRASSCVLPLFFGKLDACVVDSGNWETITELNPQVRRSLRILAHSEPLLEGLIAVPVEPQHRYKREILESIMRMHLTVAGDQLTTVFKVGPQIPVTLKDFESTANLLNRYRSLLKPGVDPSNTMAGRLNDVREVR